MLRRPGIDAPVEGDRRERLRIGEILLQTRDPLLLELLELGRVEARLARHVGDEREHRRHAAAHGLDRDRRTVDASAHAHGCAQEIETVLQLLARQRFRSPLEHRRGELPRAAMSLQRLLGAVAQDESSLHRRATRLLLEQAHSHPVRRAS